MGAPWSQIDRKAEDAIASVIGQLAVQYCDGVQVVKGTEYTLRTVPSIYVVCEKAVPEYAGDSDFLTGNWICSIKIGLVTNPEDISRTTRMNMTGELWDIFMQSDFIAVLNTRAQVPDFHAYGGASESGGGEAWKVESIASQPVDHLHASELSATLYCRPTSG